MIAAWPCPAPGGPVEELALAIGHQHARRVLIVPALFDEANRLRRFTVETMRALDALGIGSILPDLPGSNESVLPLRDQSLAAWRMATATAATHFGVTQVLTIRGGALLAPALPGWSYAAIAGAAVLRQMLRARILAAREAGREENQAGLLEAASAAGLDLNGYQLGAAMIAGLQTAQPAPDLAAISQGDIGGAGLWLRAEPGEDAAQSQALAALIADALR